jgi:O-antigen/teichoic acid export membrane protein
MTRLIAASLRLATLVARFIFILALAKFLPPAELGLYGLLFATIIFFLTILGFDFYTYAHRELIVTEPTRWGKS